MIKQSLIVLLLISIFGPSTLASGQESVTKRCRGLLSSHLQAGLDARQSLSELPPLLDQINAGTLLLRIDIQAAARNFSDLAQIVESSDGLQVPQGLSLVHGNRLYLVAYGSANGLRSLTKRLVQSTFAKDSSFQFLTFETDQAVSNIPTRILFVAPEAPEKARVGMENQIALQLAETKNFSIYNISQGQMLFFVPRESFAAQASPEFLAKHKISSSSLRRTPTSWIEWIDSHTKDFNGKRVVNFGSWTLISTPAFGALYDVGTAKAALLPRVANIEAPLRQALAQCFQGDCSTKALPATPADPKAASITVATRRKIIAYLKANRTGVNLTEPNSIRRIFLRLGKSITNKPALERYKQEINAIGFSANDYQMVARGEGPAAARFASAWQAYLKAKGISSSGPITNSSVIAAIRELER